MDGGLEACSPGNVLDFNSLKSSFQQYIGPFHSLPVRPCKSADYEDYLCIYYEKSDQFPQNCGNWCGSATGTPFERSCCIGHYTEHPRIVTLNCEYFYFPLKGMPSPSQGNPKQ